MHPPYPDISTVNATNDLTQLLVYANTITNQLFMPLVLWAFFVIALIGSYYGQLRMSGRARIEVSFATSAFVTLLFAIIMETVPGLLPAVHFWAALAITILAVIWLYFSQE